MTRNIRNKVLAATAVVLLTACATSPQGNLSEQPASAPAAKADQCCDCDTQEATCESYAQERYQYYLGLLSVLFTN